MNSFERTMAAINHQEGDRIPLFLLLSLYGAKELQIPIKEYFAKPENVVAAQLKMKNKYHNDCIDTFFYAAIEIEAFGGEVVFVDDGPPNSGEPLIREFEQIKTLAVPKIEKCAGLKNVLAATRMLKKEVGSSVPIVGVVMSPYSLPVMQMGFEKYLELIYGPQEYFARLMKINEDFCVAWANAQLAAGATAICYFNPLASPNMIERERYLATGFPVDKRTIRRIKGPTGIHLASGIALPVIDDLISTGTSILGFSANDDLEAIKTAAENKICLLGNLNAVEMVHWDSRQIEAEIKNIINKAGKGGGLLIADNHGEIPWQMPEDVLLEISQAVRKHGEYPLRCL